MQNVFIRRIAIVALLPLAACAAVQRLGGSGTGGLRSGTPSIEVADTALRSGAPDLALHVTDAILADEPRDVKALECKSEALAALGRTDEAASTMSKAITVKPDLWPAYLAHARLAIAAREPSAAEASLRKLLAHEPKNVAALTDLGVALDMLDRHAEAQAQYRAALVLSPDLASARADLGLSLALGGKAAEGVKTLTPLTAQPEVAAQARHDLALAMTLAGDGDSAQSMLGQYGTSADAKTEIAGYRAFQNAAP
jgi:Flp pilus assembly protein TadD